MQLDQLPPRRPNFALVVTLAVVVLLAAFVVAYFTFDFEGGHLVMRKSARQSTSHLEYPRLALRAERSV